MDPPCTNARRRVEFFNDTLQVVRQALINALLARAKPAAGFVDAKVAASVGVHTEALKRGRARRFVGLVPGLLPRE